MSFKMQSVVNDLTRSEPMPQVYASPTHVQRATKSEQGTHVDKLWKEEVSKDELKNVPSKAEVESAVDSINDAIEHINRALRFSVHEDTQRIMVKVVNANTDEVIKEIPPEAVLDTVARIREMIGLLIDERA